jgi:hypothetical protein
MGGVPARRGLHGRRDRRGGVDYLAVWTSEGLRENWCMVGFRRGGEPIADACRPQANGPPLASATAQGGPPAPERQIPSWLAFSAKKINLRTKNDVT